MGTTDQQFDIDGILSTVPVSYYGNRLRQKCNWCCWHILQHWKTILYVYFQRGYDHQQPFMSIHLFPGTGNLTGLDRQGKRCWLLIMPAIFMLQVAVTTRNYQQPWPKHNAAGALQWTFNGSLHHTNPGHMVLLWAGWWENQQVMFTSAGAFSLYRFLVWYASAPQVCMIIISPRPIHHSWKPGKCSGAAIMALLKFWLLVAVKFQYQFRRIHPPSPQLPDWILLGCLMRGLWATDTGCCWFCFDPVNNDMYSIFGSIIRHAQYQ